MQLDWIGIEFIETEEHQAEHALELKVAAWLVVSNFLLNDKYFIGTLNGNASTSKECWT